MRTDLDAHVEAVAVAGRAGHLLVGLRRQLSPDGANAEDLRRQGDQESHRLLVDLLTRSFPDDAVLSEEAADDASRLASTRVWIVDPLDGTREFGEPGRTDWSVHVALVVAGKVVAGAVALPALGCVLGTAEPPPGTAAPVNRQCRVVVSRSRPPSFVADLAARLHAEVIPMGSAGAKAMAVVRGEVDLFVHAGGQYEWDTAAPAAVAGAAGLHVSRINGAALEFNKPDPWSPDLLICRKDLAVEVLDVLSDLAEPTPVPGDEVP